VFRWYEVWGNSVAGRGASVLILQRNGFLDQSTGGGKQPPFIFDEGRTLCQQHEASGQATEFAHFLVHDIAHVRATRRIAAYIRAIGHRKTIVEIT
jgi:hypothetical protein